MTSSSTWSRLLKITTRSKQWKNALNIVSLSSIVVAFKRVFTQQRSLIERLIRKAHNMCLSYKPFLIKEYSIGGHLWLGCINACFHYVNVIHITSRDPGLRSLPIQMKFSADKMYYIISQENAKITNKQKTQTEDRYFSQENRSPHWIKLSTNSE